MAILKFSELSWQDKQYCKLNARLSRKKVGTLVITILTSKE
jgi:hypothetical protein